MTAITATIIPNAEAFLVENLRDFGVDGIATVYPDKPFTEDFGRSYHDEEENESKFVSFEDHVKALGQLAQLITEQKLSVGCIANPVDLAEPCNWDVEVVDAYFQLCYHGEVIYG